MNLYRRLRLLQFSVLVNVALLITLIVILVGAGLACYTGLPENSPVRRQLKFGRVIAFFEPQGMFINYRNLGIPIYELEISPKNIQKIEENLPRAGSIMTEEYKEYVPAVFHFQGEEYKVKTRIRGLTPNHWRDKKKSWRIKFDSAKLFNGIKHLDLIIPQDRAYITEHFSNYLARKMGLLTPDSGFAFLVINGKLQGVYFETEHPGNADFLAKHQRADNANFYNDDTDWNWLEYGWTPLYENIGYWGKDAAEQVSGMNNFADLNYLLTLVNEGDDAKFYAEISNILEMEKFLSWQSHSMLMGSFHQCFNTNINMYFDPECGRFEPVPWDVNIWPLEELFFDQPYNPLVTRILKSPELRHRRNRILWNYVNSAQNNEDDLTFYDQTYNKVKPAFFVDRNKGFSNLRLRKDAAMHRGIIINNRRKIRSNLAFCKLFVNVYVKLPKEEPAQGQRYRSLAIVDIMSYGFSAAVLERLSLNFKSDINETGKAYFFFDENASGEFDAGDKAVGSLKYNPGTKCFVTERMERLLYPDVTEQLKPKAKSYRFFIVGEDCPGEMEVEKMEIEASNAVTDEAVSPRYSYVDAASFSRLSEISRTADEFAGNYSFLIRPDKPGNKFIIPAGECVIAETVIVPRGMDVEIQPGAILKFAPGVALISYSPVQAAGEKDAPIVFTALDKNNPWGVFAVVNTKPVKSIFKNVTVEYGQELVINGINFTGALACHNSAVQIEHCLFRYNQGDDAVNVKRAEGMIKDCIFHHNASDGIDFDFASGQIKNNLLFENKGDGIDLCNSHITILNNHIKQSGDKGISIGERSNPVIINNLIHSCVIGIGIKDASHPQIINNTIVNNEFGIKSYMKKAVFGGAAGTVSNTVIWENSTGVELDSLSMLDVSDSLVQGGMNGKNILDIEPVFINAKEENYLLSASARNQLLLKGAEQSQILEFFPELAHQTVPIGIFRLPGN